MKHGLILLLVLCAGVSHAAPFLKITKGNSVIGYKEPTTQSKMLNVFAEGDEVQILLDKDGWFKVKIPFSQGYFLTGWVPKNAPNTTVIQRGGSSVVTSAPSVQAEVVEEPKKTSKRSTGLDRSTNADMERWGNDESMQMIRVFGGPVFDLHKYGAFQYRAGLSYEIPLTQTYKFGIPVSYTTGDGFNAVMLGLENMYSFYFSWFALTPRLGAGYEYFYGNGRSFQAISAEAGISFDVSISKHFTLGVEPFTGQAMFWNTTDSLNKIPFNVRAQSLLLIRGRW